MAGVLTQEELDNRVKVTVPHPEFGHVVFSNPTQRQEEILSEYLRLVTNKSQENEG